MIQVRASQIFTNDRDQAVAAKKQLDAGSPFTEIVEKYSTCPSKQNGGDLGWMPEANASALMGTVTEKDEGRILGPIHSPYGYHILKITEIKVEEAESVFHADTPMVDIIKVLPEIHTLLFQKFHIGMPVSGYAPEETLFTLCEKHSKNIGEVLAAVNAEAAQKAHPTMAPEELQIALESPNPPALLDIREKWEHDIANIPQATLITRETCQEILASLDKNSEIVLIDWKGDRSPSFQKYLTEHGFTQVKGLEGGIDAWSEKVDTRLSRYDIDEEDEGYRYEDIFDDLK